MNSESNSLWGRILRVGGAFLVSPFIGLLAAHFVFQCMNPRGFGWLDGPIPRIGALPFYIMSNIPAAYTIAVVAAPVILFMRWMGLEHPLVYAIAGILMGTSGWYDYVHWTYHAHWMGPLHLEPYWYLQPAVCGAVALLTFWFLAVRRKHRNPSETGVDENDPAAK